MNELVAFLLARIAEDEAEIRADLVGRHWPDPDRALSECEAKRHIVHYWDEVNKPARTLSERVVSPAMVVTLARVVQIVAHVYAEHPDYRSDWWSAA